VRCSERSDKIGAGSAFIARVVKDGGSGKEAILIAWGGVYCTTETEVAAKSDVIIMVSDTPDGENVLFAADDRGAKGLSKGTIVVDVSSIAAGSDQDFAKCTNALGCDYLDAPRSGGTPACGAAVIHGAEN
jgi:2-hydroxy-3-oxopropionate reductase